MDEKVHAFSRSKNVKKRLLCKFTFMSWSTVMIKQPWPLSHRSLVFSLTERIRCRKMFLLTCWLIVWPWCKNSVWTIPWTSKKVISIISVLDLNTLAFLGFGDNALFHSSLCRLVSGSYLKIHDWSPVTTFFSKLGSVLNCSKMSWHTCTRCSFVFHSATLVSFLHRSSVMILHTISLCIPSSSTIILTVRRRSLHTFCLTCSTFSCVLLVDGLPLLWSSSTSSLPSLNLLCHSKRWVLDIVSSP